MAKVSLLAILLCQMLTLPILGGRTDENNPLLGLASAFLQNMGNGENNMEGLATIGNLVGSLMQGDNAKNLGSLFGQGNGNTGDMLSSLGSLLGGQDGKIDPSMIGTMISMFAQSAGSAEPNRQKRENKDNMNVEGMLNLAASFLNNKNTATYLPMIMNAIGSFTESEADKRADDHKDHASFLPPILEKIHVYWDIFINSKLGKNLWEKFGIKKIVKSFTGPDGNISFEMMFKNFENQSFRRHWMKVATKYLTEIVVTISKPEVYEKYAKLGQYLANNFLDSQGLPKNTHLNMKKPAKSVTALINYILKKYLDFNTDVSEYVTSATDYLKQTLKMADQAAKTSSGGDYSVVADRLTDTLNLEVIEPVLRVYRAYKHSLAAPQCQEHLMCLVNRHHDKDEKGVPGFKVGLTKFSSLVASAALSFQNGKGFWDLYNAIQNDVNCEATYPADCSAFHEHELKVTTEVYHSEL